MIKDANYLTFFLNKKKKGRSGTSPETKIFGAAHAHSVPHFALNLLSVLFLKAIVRSQRIFSLSKTQKIPKLGEVLFNHERKMWYFVIITFRTPNVFNCLITLGFL